MSDTHVSDLKGRLVTVTTKPSDSDNDAGDMYFNTVLNVLYYWTGSTWLSVQFS